MTSLWPRWTVAVLLSAAFSVAHAAFLESEEEGGSRYFLFSLPNKVERFDLSGATFLEPFVLSQSVQQMVGGNYLFLSRDRKYGVTASATAQATLSSVLPSTVRGLSVLGASPGTEGNA